MRGVKVERYRVSGLISSQNIRDCLWESIPESRSLIRQIESEEYEMAAQQERDPFIGVYDYLSQVFWWGVFESALKGHDESLVMRCYAFVEEMMNSSDALLKEGVGIRVLPHLLQWGWSWRFAGARVREELALMTAGGDR